MFKLIKNLYEAKTSELALRSRENSVALSALQEASSYITERPGGAGWDLVGRMEKGLTDGEEQSMIAKARQFFRFDPLGRPAIWNAVKYIMGRGVTITPKSDDPKVWFVWRDFWTSERNKMELRQFEIILRMLRDGNTLLQFFNKDENGLPTWKTTVRFRDPLLLRKPTLEYMGTMMNGTHGIMVDPDDIETAVAYWFMNQVDRTKFEKVEAKDILHIKIFADSDQKMGESMIQPVMKLFTHYNQWLENRIILNKVRTAVALIKKVTGTSADVSRIANTIPKSSTQPAGQDKTKNIRPGSVYVANAGVEYQMLSPNLQASDAAEDGRNIVVRIGGGVGMPEFIFGDASNSNFASTMIAESPFVKEIQYWQTFSEYFFKLIFRRVIENAVAAGVLTAPKETTLDDIGKEGAEIREATEPPVPGDEPGDEGGKPGEKAQKKPKKAMGRHKHEETDFERFFGCDLQWPEIIHREIKATTDAVIAQRDAGIISDPTACAVLGYDYDEEMRKQRMILEDAETNGNPFMQGHGDELEDALGDADEKGEIDEIMNSLNDEEKESLKTMASGEDVMKFLQARKPTAKKVAAPKK